MSDAKHHLLFPREVLLVKIVRRCTDARCDAKTRLGLTKEEARAYAGFNCERCERWHDDALSERDIPDWWEELKITDLNALREQPEDRETRNEASEVVTRLSDEWRRRGEARGAEADAGEDER